MKRLSDKLVEEFNKRIKAELESAYIYEAMANWLTFSGFPNAGKVWKKNAEDERSHAEWAFDYMKIMDVLPETPVIAKPTLEFKDIKEVIDKTTEHEYLVTKQCNDLAVSCMMEKDLLSYNFVAQKYLTEQVEELERCLEMQRYITKWGNDANGFIALEDYFGKML